MRLSRLSLGLILAGLSGGAFGWAFATHRKLLWGTGGAVLLAGVLLVLSALRTPRRRAKAGKPEAPAGRPWLEWRETAVPRLGTLLVDKYRLITETELTQALALQKGSPKRLGELLIDMGLITESDLELALRYQRSLQEKAWSQTDPSAPRAGGNPGRGTYARHRSR